MGKDLSVGPSTSCAPGEDNIPLLSQDQAPAPAPAPTPALELTHEPTHSYTSASDTTHSVRAGPTRPVVRDPGLRRHEPGYCNTTNIYNLWVAQVVYERVMKTLITIMQGSCFHWLPRCAYKSPTLPTGVAYHESKWSKPWLRRLRIKINMTWLGLFRPGLAQGPSFGSA